MLVVLKRMLYGTVVITPIVAVIIITIIFPIALLLSMIVLFIYAAGAIVDQEWAEHKRQKNYKDFIDLIPHG